VKDGQTVAQVAAAFGLSKGRSRRIMKANGYVPAAGGGGPRFAFRVDEDGVPRDQERAVAAYQELVELGKPVDGYPQVTPPPRSGQTSSPPSSPLDTAAPPIGAAGA